MCFCFHGRVSIRIVENQTFGTGYLLGVGQVGLHARMKSIALLLKLAVAPQHERPQIEMQEEQAGYENAHALPGMPVGASHEQVECDLFEGDCLDDNFEATERNDHEGRDDESLREQEDSERFASRPELLGELESVDERCQAVVEQVQAHKVELDGSKLHSLERLVGKGGRGHPYPLRSSLEANI